jgi:hypothetical protein
MKTMIGLVRLSIAMLVGVIAVCAGCAGCAAEPDTRAHGEATLRPALVSQRVNAVVRRQARQLLHLETEHQSFVTTPEHPFATVGSGWVRAGELAPGDRVISAKFGSLRVSSVRIETRAQPVPVFNLRVERAHAYWAGSADVLVHNTGCGAREDNVTLKTREVEEIQRQLAALKNGEAASSSEQPFDRKNRIEALEAELKKAKHRLAVAKSKAKGKTQARDGKNKTQRREDNIASKSREVEKARRELEALEKTVPTSREHALQLKKETAELKSNLWKLNHALIQARHQQKLETQPDLINQGRREILRGDALKAALAAAQAELHELRRQRTGSHDSAASPGSREAELEKLIREHTYDLKKEDELRELENRLAQLEKVVPTPAAPRPGLESEKQQLKLLIKNNKIAATERRGKRRRAEDPGHAASVREYHRTYAKRARRSDSYVNDQTRSPDTIDRLEQEVAELTAMPSSPSRDWRLEYGKARLERLKRLAKFRNEAHLLHAGMYRARNRRQSLIKNGQDPTRIDEKLAAHEQRRKELLHLIAVERAREILDGFDDGQHAASPVDPTSPFGQEFLDELLSEMLNEQAAREEQLEQDTLDVDEEMRLITELLASIPSPAPGEVSDPMARLSGELREERAQFNDSNFALVNEYAYLSSTLGHDNPAAVRRMAEIQTRIQELKLAWQENTQKRLDETRKLLLDMQRTPRLRDDTLEAELAEQIGLLEHELAHPPF